ncbi:MAG: hypothetical protein EOO48_01575 [Flavobacterium sp.]|nr:MAG: hypothetical protein EOO48_01575 [Flavobacterium sp.]
MKKFLLFFTVLFWSAAFAQPKGNPLLEKGWAELVKDNDNAAFVSFSKALDKAKLEKNTADQAEALLYMGICSFGSSLEKGLQYATLSLDEFKKLEPSDAQHAKIGRSKCLQLISTIYIRQNKFSQAKQMSREVINTLRSENDASGTLGLAYNTMVTLYQREKKVDSASVYSRLALADFEKYKNFAYLPNAFTKIAQLENNPEYFKKGLAIADSTQNKQAQVSCLLSYGKWMLNIGNQSEAESYFNKAHGIALTLTDRIFEIQTLEALIDLKNLQRNYPEVSKLQAKLLSLKDTFYSLEREQIVKSLEVQFEVSEKNRKLDLVNKERQVAKLTNVILLICIALLLLVFGAGWYFLKSINKRDKQLLKTKEELVEALEKQKTLKEQQFQNDLEHKESQLSAITLQMLQKNELLDEIKNSVDKDQPVSGRELVKMVNKHLTQDNGWNDFELYFESLNKNFYTRLKQRYPDISANDLKICALIKLNLSIKEMASILNISPDSVKTARYRLRKKLQLVTEENLTDFILSV